MSETVKQEQVKKGSGRWLGIVAFVVAAFAAWQVSKLPIRVTNLAVPFNGDVSRSVFVESDTEEPFFSHQEVSELTEYVQAVAGHIGMNVVVYASRSPLSDAETVDFANASYDRMFGEHTDGVFFYVDMSGKVPAFDYFSTSGKAVLCYGSWVDAIMNGLDQYFPSSSEAREYGYEPFRDGIYRGIVYFLQSLESYYASAGESSEYVRSSNSNTYMYFHNGEFFVTTSRPPKQRFYLMLAGLIVGFIAAFLLNASVKKKYVFVAPIAPERYISNDDSSLARTDTFLRENTVKHYNPPVSSSSGSGRVGSGGGGGYHGGSHGGGGHHR